MEQLTIPEIKLAAQNDRLEARVFVQVEGVAEKQTRDGKPYREVSVADAQGRFSLRAWSDSPHFEACGQLTPGAFLAVEGEFSVHPAFGLEARNWRMRPLDDEEQAALLEGPAELRAKQTRDFETIVALIGGMADPRLRGVSELFLAEHGERFRRAAAARTYHHARRGGLVEHVAQMMRAADALAGVYALNRDLLLAGVLFHDTGKLWENCPEARGFGIPYHELGELMGHINIGIELLNTLWRKMLQSEAAANGEQRQTDEIPQIIAANGAPAANSEAEKNSESTSGKSAANGVAMSKDMAASWATLRPANDDVRNHLVHLIAAHHGELAFGSPVPPKTPEAFALHYLDNLDAKLEMMAAAYATGHALGRRITERVMPLPGNLVTPLGKYEV